MILSYISHFLNNQYFIYYSYSLTISFTIAFIGNIMITNNINNSIIKYITHTSEKSAGYLLLPFYSIYRFSVWLVNSGFVLISQKIYQFISLLWNTAFNAINFVVIKCINIVKLALPKIAIIFDLIITNVYNGLKWAFINVYNGLKWAFIKVYNSFKWILNNVYNGVKWAFINIYDGLKWAFIKIYHVIRWFSNQLDKLIISMINIFMITISNVYNWTIIGWSFLKYVYFEFIHSVFIILFNTLYNNIVNICNKIYYIMVNVTKNMINSFTNIITNIYESMTRVSDDIYISIIKTVNIITGSTT